MRRLIELMGVDGTRRKSRRGINLIDYYSGINSGLQQRPRVGNSYFDYVRSDSASSKQRVIQSLIISSKGSNNYISCMLLPVPIYLLSSAATLDAQSISPFVKY